MSAKKLKIWNGVITSSKLYTIIPSEENIHKQFRIYICAYSYLDLFKLFDEVGLHAPTYEYIRQYWNFDAWGNAMEGIKQERGIWATPVNQTIESPIRIVTTTLTQS